MGKVLTATGPERSQALQGHWLPSPFFPLRIPQGTSQESQTSSFLVCSLGESVGHGIVLLLPWFQVQPSGPHSLAAVG